MKKAKAIESNQGRAQSWWRPSRAWEATVECRWHGKVAWKLMKNNNKWRKTTKWRTKMNEKQQPTSQKPHWRFSQAKYNHYEFLLKSAPDRERHQKGEASFGNNPRGFFSSSSRCSQPWFPRVWMLLAMGQVSHNNFKVECIHTLNHINNFRTFRHFRKWRCYKK